MADDPKDGLVTACGPYVPAEPVESAAPKSRATSLSPPEYFLLDQWARQVFDAFGEYPYLVGSVTAGGDYRDVDLRLPLDVADDNEWPFTGRMTKLRVLNLGMSLWGRQTTGLPIDFQFQPLDEFRNEKGRAWPIGVRARSEADIAE